MSTSAVTTLMEAPGRLLQRHGFSARLKQVSERPNLDTSSSSAANITDPFTVQVCFEEHSRMIDGQSQSVRNVLLGLPLGTDFSGSGWQLEHEGNWLRLTEIRRAGNAYLARVEGSGL